MDCNVTGTASSVLQTNGTVTFGYGTSTLNAIQAWEDVAILTLRINPNTYGSTYLNVNVEEFNKAAGFAGNFSLMVDLGAPPYVPSLPNPGPGTGAAGGGATQPAEPATPTARPVTTDDVAGEGTVVTETTAVLESTTEGSRASASVSKEIAEEIMNQAVRNGSDTVVIAPDMGGSVTEAEVSIPASLVADIAGKTDADLRVETPVANVAIPNKGLSGLAAARYPYPPNATAARWR